MAQSRLFSSNPVKMALKYLQRNASEATHICKVPGKATDRSIKRFEDLSPERSVAERGAR
jgi:hypothetical protein